MQSCFNLSLFKGTRPKIAYFMFRLTTGCVCVSWPNYKHLWKCWPFFVQWGPTLRNTYQELFQLQQIYLADFRCRSRLPHSYFLSWSQSQCVIHEKYTLVSSQTLHLVSPQLLFCRLFGYSQSKVFALRTPWGIQRWGCNQIPDWWH